MKPTPATFLTLVAVMLALLVGASVASAETASTAQKQPAAAKEKDEPSAAERRKASSEFENEKLDQGAFKEADAEAEKKDDSGSGGSVLRAMFGLLVVLAVIYGVHYLLKKWGQSKLQGVTGSGGVIDVVATTPLAQGRALHLVRVGDELVLVGATEQSITRISDYDSTALGAVMASQGNGDFQHMLNTSMDGSQLPTPPGMSGTGANEPFIKRFLDNLRMTTAR